MKTKQSLLFAAALSLFFVVSPHELAAQGAALRAAGRAATEFTEQFTKRGGAQAAKELSQFGGETAVRELLEVAEREGGEALVQTISKQAGKYGVVALQAAKGSPRLVAEAVEKLPTELAENGLRAIAREPVVMQAVIRDVGQEGLEVAAKHPGVGSQIARVLGKEGSIAAREVPQEAAIGLARHADEIAKLAPAQKTGLLEAFKKTPGRVVAFLEKHPKTLLTAAAVTAFLATKDEILGINGQAGFLERLVEKPVTFVGYVLAGLVGLWGSMRLWFSYRGLRAKRVSP
jgi:hypothetical protein